MKTKFPLRASEECNTIHEVNETALLKTLFSEVYSSSGQILAIIKLYDIGKKDLEILKFFQNLEVKLRFRASKG